MASMIDRINKLREERIAREKARIEKLRELNLKKYNNKFELPRTSASTVSIPSKSKPDVSSVAPTTSKSDTNTNAINKDTIASKSNKGRSITAPKILRNKDGCKNNATNNVKAPSKYYDKNKVETTVKQGIQEYGDVRSNKNVSKKEVTASKIPTNNFKTVNDKKTPGKKIADRKNLEEMVNAVETIGKIVVKEQTEEPKPNMEASKSETIDGRNDELSKENKAERNQVGESNLKTTIPVPKLNGTKTVNGYKVNSTTRKSIAFMSKVDNKPKVVNRRKTMLPESTDKTTTTNSKESVFDRLYKQKTVYKKPVVDAVTKLKTDPNYLKQVITNSQMITNLKNDITNSQRITNRRSTVFERKAEVRRSISAIHFKRVPKSELSNCIHKWASSTDNINKDDVQDLNEDESLKEEKIISAIKSERKRVTFQTPRPLNLNTPKPEELQSRLQNWLKKRGKSLDSYHHLQCFGLHHLADSFKPLEVPKFDDADENKENIALEHDSDNESFLENNNKKGNLEDEEKARFPAEGWRRVSSVTDTSDFNESYVSTLTSGEVMHHVDELLLGALNDLTELLREGFDWEQCARWLRALRERFPAAPESAPYWECRAALEERRGDLHATVQCLEQAIAKGTEQSVVEASLDSLLDKFMQLKISPSCGRKPVDPKLVDVKNVFKSTIIRFAVQQAKLHQSSGTPKYTVTPVRRSHRLSRTHTPLRVCSSITQAKQLGAEFRPNKALGDSP